MVQPQLDFIHVKHILQPSDHINSPVQPGVGQGLRNVPAAAEDLRTRSTNVFVSADFWCPLLAISDR